MGTKVKFQLTPDIHMFDPTRPCDNQVKYKVFIFLKQVKNTIFPHILLTVISVDMIFLCKVLFFNDRFNKYYVFDVYCTDFA